MGLFGHFYFSALDRGMPLVSNSLSSRTLLAVKKTFVDQFICAPVATLMFYALKVVAERRPKEYAMEVRQKYVPTLLAGWQLWVPAHMINFLFIASQHRVLYTNIVAVGGTYVLSKASNAAGKAAEQQEETRRRGLRLRKKQRAGAGEETVERKEYEILSDCVVRVD